MSWFYNARIFVSVFGRKPSAPKMKKSTKKTVPLVNTTLNFGIQDNLVKNTSTFANNMKFQVLPAPVKSESDKKEYKVIRLSNGLTACLISDKSPISETDSDATASDYDENSVNSATESETDSENEFDESDEEDGGVEQKMAAAALCVGVGSFSDPKDVPGMAHFLEHMVFMGSAKYPGENDFDAFINKVGGSDNAATDAETTCFYFECLEKHLHEGLDRFAQFFIEPLMKKEAMTREREAIHSEFQMQIPLDSSRREQLLLSLAKKDSPVNSFSWGNLTTLRDNIADDVLYKNVHEFRKRHYSANRMTLAVQARLPMDTLEEYVLEYFSKIPSNNLPPDDFGQYLNGIFDTPEFARMYYVKPSSDVCQVELTWALPSLLDKYKSKPQHYISYLMGDEGKGSLLSYLRKKVWVLSTSIGNEESGSEHNTIFTLFTVTMLLTQEGLAHIFEVIEAVFSYINLLKELGPQERVFNELKAIHDTSFKFASEDPAIDYVEEVCETMQIYPPEDYIAGSELYYEYDPKAITNVLDCLRPDKMNIMISTKNLPDSMQFNQVEKWFGTEYTDKEVPTEWITKWSNVKPYLELNIPPPNPYLTTDFSILPEDKNHPDYPENICTSSILELWYRKDQKFKLPLACYNIYLISPMSIESPKSTCLLEALVNLLQIDITEDMYPANSANLYHTLVSYDKGLLIKLQGYNQNLPVVIDVIAKHLVCLSDNITNDMFYAVKDKLVKHHYNKLLKPAVLAKNIRKHMLITNYWAQSDLHSAMLEISYEDVKMLAKDYLKNLHIKALVQGNVTKEVALTTVQRFVDTIGCKSLAKDSYPTFRVVQIPKGEICARMQSFNTKDSNSIITNYYQSGPFSMRTNVIIDVIMMIIEEPLFDTLRTKEQLGYHVYITVRDTFGILGYTITVNAQATKNTTEHVDSRIEEFMKYTQQLLSQLSQEEFEERKAALKKQKQCVDVHLKEEFERNWSEIAHDEYMFDRIKQEIDMIDKITLEDIKTWWAEHNSYGNKENFRKLSIQVVGHNTNEKDEDNEKILRCSDQLSLKLLGSESDIVKEKKSKDYFLRNLKDFKQNLYLFPLTTVKKSS